MYIYNTHTYIYVHITYMRYTRVMSCFGNYVASIST